MPRQRSRRREKKFVPQGKAFISATFNNTLITFTDPQGNVISQSSAGAMGFRGSRKSTALLRSVPEKQQLELRQNMV
ncbi:MAG: hypothetical protein Ct9H300mP19_19510 [Dehalococcoidia bacterium]|nr:MAG: hypothetical protein Ct9H300mP19_19510 [Dehalococcoidia bacterium]